MRKHLGYALPFAAAVLVEMLQSNLHLYVVSARLTPAAFAIYSIGCLQIPMVDFMTTSTANVMMVRMSSYIREQRHGEALELWWDTSRKLAIVFVPLVGVLIVTAGSLIPGLFTEKYSGSVPLFMVWSVLMLFPALMTNGVLRVFADTKFIIKLNLIKLLIIAAGINIFITTFGMMGAVLITLLAMATAKIVALDRISKLLRCSWHDVLPWRQLARIGAISVGSALPVVALRTSVDLPPLLEALLIGTAYGLLCAAGMWIYGPLNQTDRDAMLHWVQVPIARISRVWKT
jgi:O-antigen/teichoic acid export membrane protein